MRSMFFRGYRHCNLGKIYKRESYPKIRGFRGGRTKSGVERATGWVERVKRSIPRPFCIIKAPVYKLDIYNVAGLKIS